MHTIFKQDTPVLSFFHIPKTGTTSITSALNSYFTMQDATAQLKHVCKVGHANIPNLTDKEYLANNRVCVLRHPYDRAMSLWHHCTRYHEVNDTINHFFLRLSSRYPQGMGNSEHEPESASVDFFAPQWHWAQHCNIYLNFNNLNVDFNNVLNRYVMPGIYNLPRKNVTNNKNLPVLKRHHKKLIQKIYADDFEHLDFIP